MLQHILKASGGRPCVIGHVLFPMRAQGAFSVFDVVPQQQNTFIIDGEDQMVSNVFRAINLFYGQQKGR